MLSQSSIQGQRPMLFQSGIEALLLRHTVTTKTVVVVDILLLWLPLSTYCLEIREFVHDRMVMTCKRGLSPAWPILKLITIQGRRCGSLQNKIFHRNIIAAHTTERVRFQVRTKKVWQISPVNIILYPLLAVFQSVSYLLRSSPQPISTPQIGGRPG